MLILKKLKKYKRYLTLESVETDKFNKSLNNLIMNIIKKFLNFEFDIGIFLKLLYY